MVSICYQLMSFILLTQSSFPGHQHLQKSSNNVSVVFLFLTRIIYTGDPWFVQSAKGQCFYYL